MSSLIKLPQHAVVSCCKERKSSCSYGEPRKCSGQEIIRRMELLFENQKRLQEKLLSVTTRKKLKEKEMAMAFCIMESSSWCRYSNRRKRRRRLLQKRSGAMEAGYGSRARHWNGIKSGVTDGWTSRDYNFQLIASSDSSSSEEDGANPAEHPDDQRMLSPRLSYFYRLFL
jgi:hypothetical protein